MNDNDELLIKAIKDLELGNYKQARDNFQIALSKNNENADSWVFFGFCQIKLKDFENAYNSFNNALKIDNQHSFAWSGKAYLLCLSKNYKKALLYCNIALNIYPDNKEAIKIKNNLKKTLSNDKKTQSEKINKIKIEDLLNSFNNMGTFEDIDKYTAEFNSVDLNKKEGLTTLTDLNHFKNIFTEKRIKLLFKNTLTVNEYNKILLKIKKSC